VTVDLVIRNQFPAGEKVEATGSDGSTKTATVKKDGSVAFKVEPGAYRLNCGDQSIIAHAKEPGQNAPIGSIPTAPVPTTDVRYGLQTGSRAPTELSEGEAPDEETETVTPIDEPAPAGLVTP
jgi:hypothetical protein